VGEKKHPVRGGEIFLNSALGGCRKKDTNTALKKNRSKQQNEGTKIDRTRKTTQKKLR